MDSVVARFFMVSFVLCHGFCSSPVGAEDVLPIPISNNAVAQVETEDGIALFSFLGLEQGKTWKDTSTRGFALYPWENRWLPLASVPGEGRLAAVATGVGGAVYLFGGYTVAEDHSEKSVPGVYRYNLSSDTYTALKPMPIPVDDAVALVYDNRFVYLVSGWHDSGNVNLVQVYDTESGLWFQATPFPGSPVFGHAGGIVGNQMVVCDGVKIQVAETSNRSFVPSDECYLGKIRGDDLTRIDWYELPNHPGAARYRMAAVGSSSQGDWVIFVGGSDNPYNYDGIGYNGEPSEPHSSVFAYDLKNGQWLSLGDLDEPTMDHRGLLETSEGFVVIGGMIEGQAVSNGVRKFRIEKQQVKQ